MPRNDTLAYEQRFQGQCQRLLLSQAGDGVISEAPLLVLLVLVGVIGVVLLAS